MTSPARAVHERILAGFRPFQPSFRVPQSPGAKVGTGADALFDDPSRAQLSPPTTSPVPALPGDVYRPAQALEDRLSPLSFPHLASELTETGAYRQPLPSLAPFDTDSAAPKEKGAYNLWCKAQWAEIFRQPELSLDDLTPYRVRAAWRLVREMARARGAISPDMMLLDLDSSTGEPQETPPGYGTSLQYDPWTVPDTHDVIVARGAGKGQKTAAQGNEAYQYVRTHAIIRAAEESLEGKDEYRPFQYMLNADTQVWETMHYKGLPLLPPPVPLPWIEPERPDQAKAGYDPSNPVHDPALAAYMTILKGIVSTFYMDLGTEDDQNAGRYGVAGLLDPWTIRLAFPSKFQIMAFEGLLVEETLTLIVQGGKQLARERLSKAYGLQPIECLQLIRIASAKAAELASGDLEEERAVMIMRLEEAGRRAKGALDIRAEIAALKNIAIIQGLARVEPESVVTDFINVVRAASRGAKMVENRAGPSALEG